MRGRACSRSGPAPRSTPSSPEATRGPFPARRAAGWIWLPLCVLFLAPFVDPRRPLRLIHLDLLALLGFSVSLAFFNHAQDRRVGRAGLSGARLRLPADADRGLQADREPRSIAPARAAGPAGGGHRRAGRLPHRLHRDRGQGDRRRARRRDRRRPADEGRRRLRGRRFLRHADPRRRLRAGQLPGLRAVRAGCSRGAGSGTTSRPRARRRSASSCSPRWRCSGSAAGVRAGPEGATLGIALAYAWLAYPFTMYTLGSSFNDGAGCAPGRLLPARALLRPGPRRGVRAGGSRPSSAR